MSKLMINFPIAGEEETSGLGFTPYRRHDFKQWDPGAEMRTKDPASFKMPSGDVFNPEYITNWNQFHTAREEAIDVLLQSQGFDSKAIEEMKTNFAAAEQRSISGEAIYPPPDVLFVSFINAAKIHPVDEGMAKMAEAFSSVVNEYNKWIANLSKNLDTVTHDFTEAQLNQFEAAYVKLLDSWKAKWADGYKDVVVDFKNPNDPFFQSLQVLFPQFTVDQIRNWKGNDLLQNMPYLWDIMYNYSRGILIPEVAGAGGAGKPPFGGPPTIRNTDGNLIPYNPAGLPMIFKDEAGAYGNALVAKKAEDLVPAPITPDISNIIDVDFTNPGILSNIMNWMKKNPAMMMTMGFGTVGIGLALYTIFSSKDSTGNGTVPIDHSTLDAIKNQIDVIVAKIAELKTKRLTDAEIQEIANKVVAGGSIPPGLTPEDEAKIKKIVAQLKGQNIQQPDVPEKETGMSTGAKWGIGLAVVGGLGLLAYALMSGKKKGKK